MTQKRLALLGGGGFAREVAEIAELGGWTVTGCYALNPGTFASIHRGYLDELMADAANYDGVALGIGATDRRTLTRRQGLIDRLREGGLFFPPMISPHAVVAASASIGEGAFVAHQVIVGLDCLIKPFGLINSAAILGHDVQIATNAIVAPGAFLGGGSSVGAGSLVGPLAKVLQGVAIGSNAILGIGCVALRNLPDGSTVWPRPDRAT